MYSTTYITQIRSIPAFREITDDDKYQGCNPFPGMHGTMKDYRRVFALSLVAVDVYSSYCMALSRLAKEKDFGVDLVPEMEI